MLRVLLVVLIVGPLGCGLGLSDASSEFLPCEIFGATRCDYSRVPWYGGILEICRTDDSAYLGWTEVQCYETLPCPGSNTFCQAGDCYCER